MLTANVILSSDEVGLIRPVNIARILGVPLEQRQLLLDWIDTEGLWHERPVPLPLAVRPTAGTVDLDRLRSALRAAIKRKGLPFTSNLQEVTR